MLDIGPETLDRTIKQLVDSGEATVEQAYAIFAGYRLVIEVDRTHLDREDAQIALITLVRLAVRVFNGGVYVVGCDGHPLLARLPFGSTIVDAVLNCGGRLDAAPEDAPRISIGGACNRGGRFHVRVLFAGWRAGVVPADFPDDLSDVARPPAMPMAPVLGASLAIAEAFEHVRSASPMAGQFPTGLSLWAPHRLDWLTTDDDAPTLSILPSKLWLIGLGHIGQAYLWCLGLLPYEPSAPLQLVLQDVDKIGRSTPSTSILSSRSMVGHHKTREMATWAEQRGFQASIIERRFDAAFRISETDPCVAMCGLDNLPGRRALDKVGFGLVIEAGLGSRHDDFRSLRLHTLPGRRTADEVWKDVPQTDIDDIADEYRRLKEAGVLDQCGMALLAGKAVGAAFVGCSAAALAVSEVLRFLQGGPLHESIDLDLRAIDHRLMVRNPLDLSSFNPGFVYARR
ncbi:thiamine biosynthesis protein ThiF [Paraburkholderia pallida]|uniref:Thiamine biosynthesis protein ThiF n=1 Tax=Paraburkholderia pallida TaxID=2547399 RepID=A0A4P7D577_9BURK|nr:thiamine biosynthesis protein ThiF [Paraburkholderia pallida]QBR02497.1 thiamine biosynthesis protein ThiF [Paraburkholderia pallida]